MAAEVISDQSGAPAATVSPWRNKYRQHRLMMLFGWRGLTWREGMNLLQEGPELFISDNCVEPEDVAPCDVQAVLERAGVAHLWTS